MGDLARTLSAAVNSVTAATGMNSARQEATPSDPGTPMSPLSSLLPPSIAGAPAGSPQVGGAVDSGAPDNGDMSSAIANMAPGSQPQPDASGAPAQLPAPPDNPYDGVTSGPQGINQDIAQTVGTPEQSIDVTGDDWHPSHESPLARIADLFMNNVFHRRIMAHDEKSAMQGFTKDPVTAINRIRQIDPSLAWRMFDEYSNTHKGDDETQAKLQWYKQKMQETGFNRMAAMAGAAQGPNAGAIWGKIYPTLQKTAQNFGMSADDLPPEEYDPDKVTSFIKGSIDPDKQVSEGITAAHDQAIEGNDARRTGIYANRASVENTNTADEIANRRANTQSEIEYRRAMAGNSTERANKAKDYNASGAGGPLGVMDPGSKQQIGVIDPKTNTATITAPGGAKYKFRVIKDAKGRYRLGELIDGGNASRNPDGSLKLTPDE